MTAVMAGRVVLGMIGEKPVIDATGKVMGIPAGILSIKNTLIKEDADFLKNMSGTQRKNLILFGLVGNLIV